MLLGTILASATDAVRAQCQPGLGQGFGGVSPTSGINFVTLDLDIQSFPDTFLDPNTGDVLVHDLRSKVAAGVELGSEIWNDACQGQPANRSALIPLRESMGLDQSSNALVFYGRQNDRSPKRCPADPSSPFHGKLCYAFAENRYNPDSGEYQIEIFQEGGVEGDLKRTLHLFDGKFQDLFAHEFGHIFGFAESPCPGSVMHQDTAFSVGGQVTAADCALLQSTHTPRDPLASLGNDDNGERSCVLFSYCEQGSPWATIRNECGWVLRTVSEAVDVTLILPGGAVEFVLVVGRAVPEYTCANFDGPIPPTEGDLPTPPPIDLEVFQGPAITLALPRESEPVTDSLYLRGWVSSWPFGVGDVAVWVDGQQVDPSRLSWGFYSPELCNAGVDPATCDPHSGLEAILDVSGLAPGEHWLDVAAVDTRSGGPLASHLRRRFVVTESPNHDPVAIDDEAVATVDLVAVAGLPVDIDLTHNDYDPDGDPIRLTNQGVVQLPSHGMVQRLSDHVIRYTPDIDAPPTDSFRYAIRDPDNRQARADVEISIYYLFAFP